MEKMGTFPARWRGEGEPSLSYIRGKAVALYAVGGAALSYRRGVGAGEAVSFVLRRMGRGVPAVSNARRRDDFPRGCKGAGISRLLLRCSCVVAGGAALSYRRGVGVGEAVSFVLRRMGRGVPAVSNARRRVDRLRGGQHCRRALEIRSEVSAPALMVPRYLGSVREVTSLLFSGSGGLGLRLEAFRFFRAFHLRPPSQATAGSARTRLGN